MSTEQHYYQSQDGLRLFYRDSGADMPGPPVLCLPGLTRNSRDFEDLADALSPRRRVLCPDFRGRGFSDHDPDWKNYHPLTYVQDVWSLLDHVGVERVIVIGTSLGGLCAMVMAASQHNRIGGVVMNDIGPEINPAGIARVQSYTGRQSAVQNWDDAVRQARATYGEWLPGLSDSFWARFVRRSYREDEDGVPRLDMDANIGRAVREVGPQKGDPWELFDALAGIPVTVLWGELSDILTVDITEKMQQRLPHIDVVRVSNRGHVPLLDEPEAVAAIDAMLETVP
jgi:pimeloyl-ACP methyl ester carboxylesterase